VTDSTVTQSADQHSGLQRTTGQLYQWWENVEASSTLARWRITLPTAAWVCEGLRTARVLSSLCTHHRQQTQVVTVNTDNWRYQLIMWHHRSTTANIRPHTS